MEHKQTFLILALIGIFGIAMAGAYFYSNREAASAASTPRAPTKKFRAKAGTERENARALVSSAPSVDEEKTDKPIEIWGSLEQDDGPAEAQSDEVKDALNAADPAKGLEKLQFDIAAASTETTQETLAVWQATAGLLLGRLDPPDIAGATQAFAEARENAQTDAIRLHVTYNEAQSLLERREYAAVINTLEKESPDTFPFAAHALELSVMKGIALEQLDKFDEAEKAYLAAIDRSEGEEQFPSKSAINVYRQANLRLARLYRNRGDTTAATTVARRMRAHIDQQATLR